MDANIYIYIRHKQEKIDIMLIRHRACHVFLYSCVFLTQYVILYGIFRLHISLTYNTHTHTHTHTHIYIYIYIYIYKHVWLKTTDCFLSKIFQKIRSRLLVIFLMSGSRWWRTWSIVAQTLSPISLVVLRGCVRLFVAVSFIYIYLEWVFLNTGLACFVRMSGRVSFSITLTQT